MKRILPLLIAVFTINLVTAQQKAPLKNYKMEVAPKSNPVVNNSSSLSTQPAPLWSDDCSDPTTWTFTNTSLPPLDWNWTNNTNIQSQCVTTLPASLEVFNSTTASNGFMISILTLRLEMLIKMEPQLYVNLLTFNQLI